jgi:thermitase
VANRKITVLISLLISTVGISVTLTLTTLQSPSDMMPTLARIDQFVVLTAQAQTISDALSDLPIGNEMMIQWVGDSTNDSLESVLTNLGAEVVQEIPNTNAAVIVKTQPITAQQIADLPANVIVEPNYKVQSLLTYPSNDPMINDQWSFATMDVTTLWKSVEANETIVAVIDSGVCFDHPDLQGRFVDGGYDYVDDDTTPMDEMGHGCAVSGIIAANANNAIGIAGIAPNTRILPLRVLDANGIGTYADVISAIYQAVSSGADIINLSLGGQNHSQLLEQAVNYAVANGVQVVAGAGNTGTEGVFYPAKYPNVIAVGSYGMDGKRSSFSTYGNEVDTIAPGENILTTTKAGNYAYFTGTSMAVPYVTGLLALSNASGQPVDLANIMDTPAPENGDEVYALSTNTAGPSPTSTATPPVDVCAAYTEHYLVGTENSNLVEDFQMAVRCANASSADNVIDFNHQEIIIEEFDWGYSGFAAVKPIEPTSSAGKLTIENGVIKRAGYLTCPAEGTSTGTVYFRFFTVKAGGDLTLDNMMLSNGCSNNSNLNELVRTEEDGGAIYNYGRLTVNNSTLYNNRAYHYGGAIYNDGLLDINNSTIYNNLSEDEGGAIFSTSAGQVTINQTTISDNSSTTSIGGIYAQSGGTFTLSNSIVANSLSTDCDGVITFAGVNLIEDGTCDAATNGQLTGDPMLDTNGLADNGGQIFTVALLEGSPAIDAGVNAQIPVEVTTDQRGIGYPRIQGSIVDLGAYETFLPIICELYNPALPSGYTVGSVNADLLTDLTQAVECAAVTSGQDIIHLDSDEITLGHILTLTSGTTLNISSTVNISGTLNTSDNSTVNLLGSGIINNAGVMSNAGTFNIDGSMNNISGTFSNSHVITNNKSFLNTQNALFTNTSYGTVTNTLDSSFINSYGATSNNEGVFVINEDALLYNKGNSYFNNDGIIQNYDHGYEDGIFNSGTFNNRDGATIENVGTIFNLREIGIYSGTFNNQSGGVIDSSGWIHNLNYSIFNNDGTIINSDQFYNHSNGIINNHSLISNYGTFHNYINSAVNQDGTLDNFATVINAGTFVNTNVINHAGDTIRNVALLNNIGTINSNGLLDNQGTLNNTGAIITDVDNDVSSVGQITNTDTLNNATDATITIRTDTIFNNLTDGTVSNEGLIDNQGQFTNDELIYNCGIIINIHLITGTGIIDDPCLPSTPSDFAVITDPRLSRLADL